MRGGSEGTSEGRECERRECEGSARRGSVRRAPTLEGKHMRGGKLSSLSPN